MLAREQAKGPPQVAFVLPADDSDGPVGVGGDFHHRDPAAHPPGGTRRRHACGHGGTDSRLTP
ncbi:hypothetical protein ACFWR4_26630 [Streptomyces hydrogenans]|uniref:hypothetical protein n=1 Tax=Streptomyces hydrogenans TaxID=1873719 RepID=UPI0035DA6516